MKNIALILSLICLKFLVNVAHACPEVKKKSKAKPEAHVTIIALGPIARRRYHTPKQKNNTQALSRLLPPKEGEYPPSTLYYKARKNSKKHQKIRLGFNSPASINKLKPNKECKLFRRNEKTGEDYKSYFTIPALSENSQTLILLNQQSKKTDRWMNKPTLTAIKINGEELKEASVYFRNLSSESVFLKIADEKPIALKTGEGRPFSIESGSSLVRLKALKGKEMEATLIHTAVRIPKGNLTVFVFYNADPATNSGKSVGVCRVVTKKLKLQKLEKP